MPPRSSRPALFLVLAVAFLVRLAPLDHGMPRAYVPDTHMVRNALGMLRDRDPVPEVGKYSTYPYLVPYLLVPVYAAEYAAGRAVGAWAGAEQFGVAVSQNPRLTALPARALMALFGALTAWALFRAARAAGLTSGAWLAAGLGATSLLDVQLSTQERPWAALVFFGGLCLWGAVVHERSGNPRALLAAGAAAGLSFASHQAGLVFLGLCGLAWLFGPAPWWGAELLRRIGHGLLCVSAFVSVGVILGHPYYMVHGGVAQEAVAGGAAAAGEFSIGGQALRLGFSLSALERLSTALLGYDPVLVALGVAGAFTSALQRGARAATLFLVATAAYFLTSPGEHVRYLLPLCLLLALLSGYAGEVLLASRIGTVAVAALLALPLVQALRLDWVLMREDTRALAEARLVSLPSGSRVAIDHYGPAVDLSQAALERIAELRELRTREAVRLGELRAGRHRRLNLGIDAVPVEELFELDSKSQAYVVRPSALRYGATPADVLSRLGVTHLLLVDRRPGDDAPRPLQPLCAQKPSVWTLSPRDDGSTPGEALLPTEMDFPLTALWLTDRPGPWMRLFELAPPGGG